MIVGSTSKIQDVSHPVSSCNTTFSARDLTLLGALLLSTSVRLSNAWMVVTNRNNRL